MGESVLLEIRDQAAWITLNSPETRNALSLSVIRDMRRCIARIGEDHAVRAVVIRGNGPAFCAGHNLKELTGDPPDALRIREIFLACGEMMLALQRLPQPVIAQVHGVATAAGCQLVAACDLAIASEDARFGTPGVRIGLFCTTPMVPLFRLIGRRRSLEMLLTGRVITAWEAEKWGLINRVVMPEALSAAVEEWVRDIAAFSPFTIKFGKQAFYNQIDMDEPAAYGYAREAISMNCLDADAQEGIRAFIEKRSPLWKADR